MANNGERGRAVIAANHAKTVRRASLLGCVAGLAAACSSGGGGGDDTPSMTAPATPTTPTTPAPINANTFEYQQNPAYDRINALPAYESGIFGNGVLVAIVDTGINENNPEFAGRVDPRSADLVIASVVGAADARAGGPDLTDEDDHGTPVAALIGAARNSIGMHGVAPEADLLVFRTDDDSADDLSIFGNALFEGVTRAANFGAKVLNLSLGSDEPTARAQFQTLMGISAAGDVVTVIAAGNEGDPDPEESALAAIDPQAAGTAIIAGSIQNDGSNLISSFSNRAGIAEDFFLVAPGEFLRVPDNNDLPTLSLDTFSGTSASVPLIVGAAALVREVWPTLTAAQVVDILLSSATDLGAPGTDSVYGRGLLNIQAALQPSGRLSTSSITGSSITLDAGAGTSSPAFGAAALDFGNIVGFDRYNRDFTISLGDTLSWTENLAVDPFQLIEPNRSIARATQNVAGVRVQFSMESETYTDQSPEALLRAPTIGEGRDSEQVLRFAATQKLNATTALSFSQGLSPRIVDGMLGDAWAPTSTARDGFHDPFLGQGEAGLASHIGFKAFGLDVDVLAATSDVRTNYLDTLQTEAPARIANMRLGVTFGDADRTLTLQSGVRNEENAILGARFGGAIGSVAQSSTYYQSAAADIRLAGGWRFNARGSIGFSNVEMTGDTQTLGGAIEGLTSTQFAAGVYRKGLIAKGDVLSVSILQPLRVEAGDYVFEGAVAYDPFGEQLSFAEQRVGLSGAPREIDLEARYQLYRFGGGFLEAGVLHQFNALGGVRDATTGLIRAGGSF